MRTAQPNVNAVTSGGKLSLPALELRIELVLGSNGRTRNAPPASASWVNGVVTVAGVFFRSWETF